MRNQEHHHLRSYIDARTAPSFLYHPPTRPRVRPSVGREQREREKAACCCNFGASAVLCYDEGNLRGRQRGPRCCCSRGNALKLHHIFGEREDIHSHSASRNASLAVAIVSPPGWGVAMFRSKNSNTASSGGGGGRGEGGNSTNTTSSSLVPRFASLFFRKRPPKKRRKRPEIKLVLGVDGGGEGAEKKAEETRGEGEAAPLELRAKKEKDAANRQTRDRIVLIESQSSAASGEKSNSSCDAPAAKPEDSNRRAATPSGRTLLSFTNL